MNIAVLGAGGMGSAFAAFLSQEGHEVQLIGRGGDHINAVAEKGLTVRPPGEAAYPVKVVARPTAADAPAGSADVIILLTKTFDTAEAAGAARHVLADDGVAVSLQNGLGNDEKLAAVFGGERCLIGETTVGAAKQEPGEISLSVMTAEGKSVTHIGGSAIATGTARADEIASVLTAARLPTEHLDHVETAIWDKLAMAVMSPVSAVVHSMVGDMWATDEGQSLVRDMFDETVAVAAAEGVTLDVEHAWTHAYTTYQGTGKHYTSMCTDVMKGRPTELSSMAGEVLRRGQKHGIAMPVHDVVLRFLGSRGVH